MASTLCAAFEPRSRRPKTSPSALAGATIELIITMRKELSGQGLDAGLQTICWHLEHHHHHPVRVSAATVSRYLTRTGLVTRSRRRDRSRPASGFRLTGPTSGGSPASSTGSSPAAARRRSCPGSMTTPATPSASPPASSPPARSPWRPSAPPSPHTAPPPPPSPTTAWSAPPGSPAARPQWPGDRAAPPGVRQKNGRPSHT